MSRRVLAIVAGISVVTLAQVATAQSATEWVRRGYKPLAPAVTQPERTPAPPVATPPPIPRAEIAARLKQLGIQILQTQTEGSYELSHLKFLAEGAKSKAMLLLSNFAYVGPTAPLPGSGGTFTVRVESAHPRAVEAVTCRFSFDSQANEVPVPATIPVEVGESTAAHGIKSFSAVVPTEKVGTRAYNVSFSHVLPAAGHVNFRFPSTPPLFVLLGCQVDVFPLP